MDYITNQIVFDIGANSGGKTADFIGHGASMVVAVEPCTDVFKDLQERFKDNKNVVLYNCAVSNDVGVAYLYLAGGRTTNTLSKEFIFRTDNKKRFSAGNWQGTEAVKTITLDYLIEKHGIPSFCKIDVEGYEYQVIQGLSKAIPFITFEFTAEFMQESFAILEYLLKLDSAYRFNFVFNDAYEVFDKYVEYDEIKNYIQNKFGDDFYNFGMINAAIL